jgi:ankyrin repeat protein
VEKGASVNIQGFYGWSALHEACVYNKANVVRYLLQCSEAKVNLRDSMGCTPLHVAIKYRKDDSSENLQLVQLLLKHRADINVKNEKGFSPLEEINNVPLLKNLLLSHTIPTINSAV